jgi:Asp-tRNA(Asn)/Glu-tRNA(Gln) amidotransferase A subunit family amidase
MGQQETHMILTDILEEAQVVQQQQLQQVYGMSVTSSKCLDAYDWVLSGLVPLTLGTDGGGSLRIPSTLCGVVTLKATFGRLSGAGLALLSPTLGHPGPICSSVGDVALAYDLLAGPDPDYVPGLCQPAVEVCSYLRESSSSVLSGLKIGIHSEYFKHAEEEVVNVCQKVVEKLSNLGAEIIDIEIAELEEARVAQIVTILSEMASFLSREREEKGSLMVRE